MGMPCFDLVTGRDMRCFNLAPALEKRQEAGGRPCWSRAGAVGGALTWVGLDVQGGVGGCNPWLGTGAVQVAVAEPQTWRELPCEEGDRNETRVTVNVYETAMGA